ncbi:hypothetical protein GOP47_0026441 [Adiantum capillus-veneris]|nr:hypothetical protein GOP47_0026441 [Adiantum capillus-veneris]
MEEQQQHWQNAQSLELGLDLVAAARSQLRLLAAVDSHPLDLYRGPALHCAILRYENCWLRLLADHGPYASTGLPLIPPLDCAWIWHCHRLNPVQYIRDCKASYGKLLDAPNVSTGIESEAVAYTQQLWDSQFSDEKYEAASEDLLRKESAFSRKITYDLQAAIERQSSFFYQVSRPHMEEERFLYAALQRYKGFLYLLKLSRLRVFLVPTYDIDLMWHSHQACSGVYREDTVKLLGRVLNHDDTDSDRTEGQKLDTGFNRTRNLWQNMFGSSYEKAGAMYRGEPPALPLLLQSTQYPAYSPKSCSTISSWKGVQGVELRKSMQVFITVQKARNLHASQDGVVGVRLLFKNKCSTLKLETSWIKGTQNPQWKDFWSLECEEATEGLRLELLSEGVTCCSLIKKSRLIGWTEISWKSILSSSTLSLDGWVPLIMKSNLGLDQKPTSLRVSVSITPPTAVPFLLRMEYPLLRNGKRDYLSKTVYDHQNKKAFMVKINGLGAKETSVIQVYRIGCKESPEILLGSAARIGPASTAWSLLDGDMHLIINSTVQGCQLNIIPTTPSENSVTLLHGRKCQYEVPGSRQADEAGFITFVRQLQGIRNGKATALFNWKSGAMEISSEENGVLVVLLCTILSVAADTIHVASFWNSTLGKLKKVSRSDDWGSVILNKHWDLQPQRSPQFCPWYSMSSNQWLSSFYGCGAGGCGNGLKGGVNGGRGDRNILVWKPEEEVVVDAVQVDVEDAVLAAVQMAYWVLIRRVFREVNVEDVVRVVVGIRLWVIGWVFRQVNVEDVVLVVVGILLWVIRRVFREVNVEDAVLVVVEIALQVLMARVFRAVNVEDVELVIVERTSEALRAMERVFREVNVEHVVRVDVVMAQTRPPHLCKVVDVEVAELVGVETAFRIEVQQQEGLSMGTLHVDDILKVLAVLPALLPSLHYISKHGRNGAVY